MCLQEGWTYFAVCRKPAHSSFVQNRLDRDAAAHITREGSALYEADLAKHIQEHFSEVLDQFHAANAADDEDDEEEDSQEASS